jgi:hypothetical protein
MTKTDFFKRFAAAEVVQITWVIEKTVDAKPWVNITGFYSRLQQDPTFSTAFTKWASPVEQTWFKGIGQSALCFLISDLLSKTQIGLDSLIHLEASGFKLTLDGKMGKMDPKLVDYYMAIGFWYPDPPAPFYAYLQKPQEAKDLATKYGQNPTWQQVLTKGGFVPLVTTPNHFLAVCDRTKKHNLSTSFPAK